MGENISQFNGIVEPKIVTEIIFMELWLGQNCLIQNTYIPKLKIIPTIWLITNVTFYFGFRAPNFFLFILFKVLFFHCLHKRILNDNMKNSCGWKPKSILATNF